MNLEYNIYSIILLISGVAAFVMSLMVFRRLGGAVRWFGFVMLGISFWAITYGFELASSTLEQMLFWIDLEYISISFLPAFWIVFIIKFIGKERWLTALNTTLIFIFPIITLLFVWTNKYHLLQYSNVYTDTTGPFPMLSITPGPWYYVHTAYFYVLLYWGVYLMISRFRKADLVFRRQNSTILIGAVMPWIINVAYLCGFRPLNNLDLTPYAFMITTLTIGFGLLRLKLFNILPIAREKIIEDMQEGVLVLDPSNRIIDVNSELKKNLSAYWPNLIGSDISTIFPGEKKLHEIINGRNNAKVQVKLNYGDPRFFEVNVTSLFDKKNTAYSGVILLFRDVTEQKKSEEKLQQQASELLALNQLKDRLFSIISHDLRSPLVSLMELMELADSEMVSEEEFKSFLPMLSKNVGYTTGLLENLLLWSKSQLQGETINPVTFDLKSLTFHKAEVFEKRLAEKTIELNDNIQKNTMIYADMDMIKLVLRNLLANAIKFCKMGDTIQISAMIGDEFTTICISDTGTGIKNEDMEKLFGAEAFTTRGTNNEQGTGIGLLLCKDFVEKNNGRIWADSKPGIGSQFYFRLPNGKVGSEVESK
jgi:PAS domain S-box-containing protein